MALLDFYPALWVDCAIWVVWGTAVGWRASRWPVSQLSADGPLLRLRRWEDGGAVYRRVGIRRWKRYLPDLGGLFGGRRKRLQAGRGPAAWAALAVETRRAELAHWVVLLALPVEAVLHGGVLLAAMAAYAAVANVPCILVQRHTRGRLLALGARRQALDAGRRAAVP